MGNKFESIVIDFGILNYFTWTIISQFIFIDILDQNFNEAVKHINSIHECLLFMDKFF